MCKVSDKIKFCTCAAGFKSLPKRSWSFYRFVGDKDTFVLGSIIGLETVKIVKDLPEVKWG